MLRILKIASAFVGIIVGAGFASGQEILQYFTSFGLYGIIGAFVSTALFAYLGMTLLRVGSHIQTDSHKEAIYMISGRYLGFIVDAVIIFTLFSVGVAMIAGAGSTLEQQFSLPSYVGALIMVGLIITTMLLDVNKVITIIGSVTPFLILTIAIIAIYSISTMDTSLKELHETAVTMETTLPNWFISAVNYVSFNIAVGAGMALVMGGTEKNSKTAATGGFLGGLGIGVLILLAHLAIFSQIDYVAAYEMPLLKIVDDISPLLAMIMSVVLFGMIFNTGVSMFYAFIARFFVMKTRQARMATVITLAIGFMASFMGFTEIISFFYPMIGYMGLFLIVALLYAPIRLRREQKITK